MSIEFTSGLEKPSNIIPLPGNFIRPVFEELYGFDVPQEIVGVDGALLTEPLGEPLVTEPAGEPIAFEPA